MRTLVATFGSDYSKTYLFNEYFVCPGLVRFVGGLAASGDVLDGGSDR